MVKQGFLNLTVAEQNKVINTAIAEFANNDYEKASLNNIIAGAGISKGSMYHYFSGKEDLYLYIVEQAIAIKSRYLKKVLANADKPLQEMNIFESLELQMLASVDFALQHYQLHLLSLRLQNMKKGPLREKLTGDFDRLFEEHILHSVDEAMDAGDIRSDFDRAFVLRILKFTLMNFTEIYPDFQELSANKRVTIKREIHKLSLFLRAGLQNSNQEEA